MGTRFGRPLAAGTLALLVATGAAAQAPEPTEAEIAAYQRGWEEGQQALWQRIGPLLGPGPGPGGSVGEAPVIFGSPVGGSTVGSRGFELPDALLGGETAGGDYAIPQDWLVMRQGEGFGIFGKKEPDGSFRPFRVEPDGALAIVPEGDLPRWTEEESVKGLLRALPGGPAAMAIVPVEPAPPG